ncbi:ABC transporter substrate-binding protein [Bradyrhizobium sp. LTSP849]|uniref:ABC transporter substrate-binding protein n=1 Tax=Bradyrhizobium sp. LTSP849 TaxID=1615890 RepID=UPI0018CF333C|nr:ABC transporter substrate-binding protein [Bradyrhizobium sp. LTSP849]
MVLLGGTVTWPFSAWPQSRASRPLIAILVGISPVGASPFLKGFAQQMEALGRVEGRDYDTAVRFADGDLDRFPGLASEVVGLKPDIVVAANTTAAVAAKKATSTIPIVSIALIEPIERGLVASHAHPGGNLTGILISLDTLLGKPLQIATELLPGAKKAGLLVNAHSASSAVQRPDAERVAAALRLELVVIDVATKDQVEPAIRQLARNEIDIAIIPTDPLFLTERQRIAALLAALRLPAVYGLREHAEVGGLISYGIDLLANWRHAADLVDRILNGTAPAEIPVELPSKLELVINLKAAKTLGLEVPAALIARADEVIE